MEVGSFNGGPSWSGQILKANQEQVRGKNDKNRK